MIRDRVVLHASVQAERGRVGFSRKSVDRECGSMIMNDKITVR